MKNMTVPIVSVVMSVFNGEHFVAEAIESILNQTFRDFEFIIIDDGSTDGTADVLERFEKADSRLVVHHHQNQGQVPSLNIGCGLARGRYIARIDGDDVALPERFERQVDYLEHHPQVALVGSSITNIDEKGNYLSTWPLPTGNEEIRERLFELRDIPFCHVTLVFRAEAFRTVNGYRTAFAPAEDYDLWLRMAERWPLANLPEPLVKVRRRAHSLSFTTARQQVISRLVAWSASAIRRAGGSDPICQQGLVNSELVRSLGVSDQVFERMLMGAYQYWIDVMLQASDKAGALRIMREALESQSWKHLNKSTLANIWLAASRIYFEQGRRLQGISCAARALAARPVIAGRPIKRLVGRLGLLNKRAAQA
jgi:glycosyltransferase involved in cell wall biosynthesis